MPHQPLQSVSTNTAPLTWQQELATAFTQPQQLLHYLDLAEIDYYQEHDIHQAVDSFSLLVPLSYAQRIQKGNPNDPLLLQVIPSSQELKSVPGFDSNPVGDIQALASPGLLHKYHGRVLLITSGACPVHCRYCFRREFPYQQNQISSRQEQQALSYITQNTEINEVILSGGDPLILTNRRLGQLIERLESIAHVKRLRIHSRVPVTLPSRIDIGFLHLLSNTRLQTILVTHFNHANELLATDVAYALNHLAQTNVRLLNQSVLLRGVNDNAHSLAMLSEELFNAGIMPYYLHLLDKTSGTSHFELADCEAQAIYLTLQGLLPGYLVPKLVREIQGKQSKTLQ
ncbi:MAG: EF-P beta-lysylation protein EpmB [Methylococcales bacterium]